MAIRFYKQKTTSTFLSPFNEFKPTTVTIEIRQDPLTPHRARILSFRYRSLVKKDLDALVEQSLKMGCPFCPENLPQKAARFWKNWSLKEPSKGGRRSFSPMPSPMKGTTGSVFSVRNILSPSTGLNPNGSSRPFWPVRIIFGSLRKRTLKQVTVPSIGIFSPFPGPA